MVHEVVREEVEIVLSIDAEHADEVGRVHAVSEQFDAHSWGQIRGLCVDGLGDGKSGEAGIGALEHASVGVVAGGDPLDLGNVTVCVYGLGPAAGPGACKLVTWRIKDRVLTDDKRLSQMPRASLSVSSDCIPDLALLLRAGQSEVVSASELLTVARSDNRGNQSRYAKFKHTSSSYRIYY